MFSFLATLFAGIIKAIAIAVKVVVPIVVKAAIAVSHGVKVVANFAGVVAIKAGASKAVGLAITKGVKVGVALAARQMVVKATEKVPEPVAVPLRLVADAAIIAGVI